MLDAALKIRITLFALALIAFLSIPTAGLIYYSNLNDFAVQEAHEKAEYHTKTTTHHINSYLADSTKKVKTLARIETVKQALIKQDSITLTKTNAILDNFKDSLDASVCYLLDQNGNTVASSNRNQLKSFEGKNYSFRPYFQQAIQGSAATYMALGVTSKKRGVYFSHPVYSDDQTAPIGVAVIKAPISFIQKKINLAYEGHILLTDPNGLVFASSHKEWLYKTLWKLSPIRIDIIKRSKQFGKGPWPWIGFEKGEGHNAYDKQGRHYMVYQNKIKNYPGWNIVYIHDHKEFCKKVTDPLFKPFVYIIIALSVPFGFLAFFLYRKASHDILKRRQAEKNLEKSRDELEIRIQERTAELSDKNEQLKIENHERKKAEKEKERLITELQKALEEIKSLGGIIPICMYCKEIRDDKGYWNQLEKYITEHSDARFSHSICDKCMKKHYPEFSDDNGPEF